MFSSRCRCRFRTLGRKGTIHVFPGDDPKDLATNFCTKYELKDQKLQRLVERHITDSMKNLPQAHPTRTLRERLRILQSHLHKRPERESLHQPRLRLRMRPPPRLP